jgi:hypothetical protein
MSFTTPTEIAAEGSKKHIPEFNITYEPDSSKIADSWSASIDDHQVVVYFGMENTSLNLKL